MTKELDFVSNGNGRMLFTKFIYIDFLSFLGHDEFLLHLIVNLQQSSYKIFDSKILQTLEIEMIES